MSTNNGTTWTYAGAPVQSTYINCVFGSGSTLFAGSRTLYKSTDNGANWVMANDGLSALTIRYFASSGSNLYTSIDPAGVFLSTNNGQSWSAINNGLPQNTYNFAITSVGNTLFTSIFQSGIFKSTNNGANWSFTGLPAATIGSFATIGTDIYGVSNTAYKSTNNGANWITISPPATGNFVQAFADGTNIFLCSQFTGVYLSTNGGTNWTQVNSGLTSLFVKSFVSNGSAIFAGTDTAGVFKTTNNGANWIPVNNGLPNKRINALEKAGSTVFVATNSGVYYSTNNGSSWQNFNQGLNSDITVLSLHNYNNTLFCGTDGQSLFKRPVSEITGIEVSENTVPDGFILNQNYPNPFNPSTQIKFTIPEKAIVTLKVFDLTGREVARLIDNESRSANSYSVKFYGENLNSGVYFYELEAGEFKETKKMLLIK